MGLARRCIGALLVLAVCGCGGPKDRAKTQGAAALGGASSGEVARARAYVKQFITEDPERCFHEVELEQPQLQAREGGIGLRARPVRVVIAIDGSGSMAGRIGGQTKLELAREAATRFLDGLPASVEASLIVFGQKGDNTPAGKAKSCIGAEVLAPMSTDRAQLSRAVSGVRAVGWTPLALGLAKAETLLSRSSTEGEQVIYVVSDGEETCGGDPVGVARQINSSGTRAVVNIIGFGLPSGEAAALKAVSDAGGGGFVNVTSRADYDETLERLRESNRQYGNALRTRNAVYANQLRTSNEIYESGLCVRNITYAEDLKLHNDLTERQMRGEATPLGGAAQALLKQRHDQLQARLKAYQARLQAAESRERATIDAAADAVR